MLGESKCGGGTLYGIRKDGVRMKESIPKDASVGDWSEVDDLRQKSTTVRIG